MFWNDDYDFERESAEIAKAIELIEEVSKDHKLTWREAYPFLRGRFPIFIRDAAVDSLLMHGVVYDDDEFTEEFLQGEGVLLSNNEVIDRLGKRLIDVREDAVTELLDKIDDRKTLRKLIGDSPLSNAEAITASLLAAGFEEADIEAVIA